MTSPQIIQELIKKEFIGANKEIGRAELIKAITKMWPTLSQAEAEDRFQKIRGELQTAANMAGVGLGRSFAFGDTLQAIMSGAKRGRKYSFYSPTEYPGAPSGAEGGGSEGVAAAPPDPGSPPPTRNNDHPEDRQHIAAHIALLIQCNCLAVSMPKTTKGSRDENPDIVGIYSTGAHDESGNIPDWLAVGVPSPKQHVVVGCEVKTLLPNQGALYQAVREARHNCRYFDEAWLVGQIGAGLLEYARELGGEYNLGIIQLDEESVVNSQIIWMPTQRVERRRLGVFLGRVKGLSEKLEKLSSILKSMTDPYEFALLSLVSNQNSCTIVERLPDSINKSIKEPVDGNLDANAYASAITDLCLANYERDLDDRNLTNFIKIYLDLTGRDNDHYSKETIKALFYKKLIEIVGSRRDEANEIEAACQEMHFATEVPPANTSE